MGPFPSALASETPVPREPVALHPSFLFHPPNYIHTKFTVQGLGFRIKSVGFRT